MAGPLAVKLALRVFGYKDIPEHDSGDEYSVRKQSEQRVNEGRLTITGSGVLRKSNYDKRHDAARNNPGLRPQGSTSPWSSCEMEDDSSSFTETTFPAGVPTAVGTGV